LIKVILEIRGYNSDKVDKRGVVWCTDPDNLAVLLDAVDSNEQVSYDLDYMGMEVEE